MRTVLVVLLALALLAALAGAAAWALMVRMPGRSFAGPLPPLSPDEEATARGSRGHVGQLAGRIGERNYQRPEALDAAAAYVAQELRALGYKVAEQPFTAGGRTFRNLEATLPGDAQAGEIVVVGGHYDSVVGTPGADDNATGTAAVLELARLLRGDRITAMLSLETIGYYASEPGSQRDPPPLGLAYPDRGDFIGFVGNVASRALVRQSVADFRRHARFPSEGVAAPGWVPGVYWSDHASFWSEGYQALMITDTAPFRNPAYHSTADTPERVDYARMARVVHGVAAVVRALAGRDGHTP